MVGPLYLLASYAVFLVYRMLRSFLSVYRLNQTTWEGLIAKLYPVRTSAVLALVRLSEDTLTSGEMDELWQTIGGSEGLRRMGHNADVLVALASFAETWDPSAAAVVQTLRNEGLALKESVFRIRCIRAFTKSNAPVQLSFRKAAGAYHRMITDLLLLYKQSHVARYPALVAACNM